ncbi:MAG: hypothetical protein EXS50_01475 [Candidatus Taylorbacteria bacterium]|nr:hypothetical protein [Candidatus Taylorbacteria bacterium]
MKPLKFQKMWEAANTFVFNIDTGDIRPTLGSLPKVTSFGDKHRFFYYENGIGGAYFEEEEMKKAGEAGLKNFTNNKFVSNYFEEIDQMFRIAEKFTKQASTLNLKETTTSELKSFFDTGIHNIIEFFGYYLACQPQCVALFEKKVQEMLEKVLPVNKVTEVYTLLSATTEITKLKKEEIHWLELAINAQKNLLNKVDENVKREIEKHYDEYFLLNVGDGGKPHTLDEFIKKFEKDSKNTTEETSKELAQIYATIKHIENSQKECIKKYALTKEIIEYCNLLARIGHYRLEMRISGWMPMYHYVELILDEIGRRFSYNEKEIRFATVDEINSIHEGKKIDKEILSERIHAFLFLIEEGKVSVLAGKEAKNKFNVLISKVDYSTIKEIKGNVAMKGKVKGKAVVFRWGNDMDEKIRLMDDNSILVAGQTRPQLMPLIVKSKGIVTDEGGITSHAAIVSRELSIPCVIGTKIATQVIKDGDYIEIDAEKGIITILK